MTSQLKILVISLAALTLNACATDRTFGAASSIEVTELEDLPAPVYEIGYTIGPQEKLEIIVVGAEDISGAFFTDGLGNVTFPLLGKLELAEKSATQAGEIIADRLRGKYLIDPQVRVIPEEPAPPTISIGGQVERPGAYPAVGKTTLLRLINQAEGFGSYAKTDDVLIMRTVDGLQYIGLYNAGAIMRGNYPDPQLFANDVVMVGDSAAKRRIETILGLVPIFTSSVILVDRVVR
ncbi:polysaccharide export protein [Erythrobacter insulae]|uniref:Polysaccharide export protein n=1 Tax=Erythrobacter insulae TaxID=2584124 RepID=A0A547PB99_9SPHN|nr:polysaccharide biosynthesis/export family protein [Erythrobacter insulae]TRD11418.1 polysaccharide export protein [Erythrobacter insulae]